MENPKHSGLFKFIGIISIIFGAIFILYGGGTLFSLIQKGFSDGQLILIGIFLLAAGILKILAVKKLWQYKKVGITLYAINEIFLICALGTFYSKMEENWILITMGVFAAFGIGFMIYFKKAISNLTK
ncbi:MAG: hypothetical protein WCT53_04030 [Candidatus Gracilibacteria bacterium]